MIPEPERAAVISVDMINGFCYEGVLASPLVAATVGAVCNTFTAAWKHGIHDLVLIQDAHEPDAVEFGEYSRHCVRGSSEAQTIPEIAALPFFDRMVVIPKNSIHPALNTGFEAWLAARPQLDTFVILGDCTDLCTYQLAMFLRLQANANQLKRRVIVPVDSVATYDLPFDPAQATARFAHPAEFFHPVFLYHLALNGMQLVHSLT
jgi:nicotinamidase-related amidase